MIKYELKYSTQFKKDFKKIKRDQKKLVESQKVFQYLINDGTNAILEKMKPHQLKGNYKNHWECHILSDLLLIWLQFDEEKKQIHLIRIGSHAEILKM